MKFVFFGTPDFAAVILEKLINADFIPAAVVCNPDKPVGRKKIITLPAVKKLLIEKFKDLKIEILQPEILANYKLQITNYKPDFFIVAAYNKILPKEILEIPRLGTIGVHPSLLPKYRGPSPIQTAILNGDKITGVTLYLMDEKIDNGPILARRELPITNDDDYDTLSRKLAELGADLLIDFLRKMNQYLGSPTSQKLRNINIKEVGLPKIESKPQDESQATYTKKFKTEDAFIEPADLEKAHGSTGSPQEIRQLAIEIDRKIRALNPEPGVWTTMTITMTMTKRMKILEAILTPEGKLKLKKIQFEGKKPINV
ncbi:MAG: methionyl-tRNA formyltransferase [bacterium]|nr:methionyl-tRNA formyltransferase [bacterium]